MYLELPTSQRMNPYPHVEAELVFVHGGQTPSSVQHVKKLVLPPKLVDQEVKLLTTVSIQGRLQLAMMMMVGWLQR